MKSLEQYIEESLLDDIDDLEQKSDDIVKISTKLIGHYNTTGTYISAPGYLNKYLDKNAIKKLGIKANQDTFKVYSNGKRINSPLSSYISRLTEYIMYNLDIEEFKAALAQAKTDKHYRYKYINVSEYMQKTRDMLSQLFQVQFTIDILQDKILKINFGAWVEIEIELEKK